MLHNYGPPVGKPAKILQELSRLHSLSLWLSHIFVCLFYLRPSLCKLGHK